MRCRGLLVNTYLVFKGNDRNLNEQQNLSKCSKKISETHKIHMLLTISSLKRWFTLQCPHVTVLNKMR